MRAAQTQILLATAAATSASPSPGATLVPLRALLRPSPRLQGWEPADTAERAATLCCSARAQDVPPAQAASFPHTPGEGDGSRGQPAASPHSLPQPL